MANRDLSLAELQQLERLVDVTNVQSVLQALSEICELKAEHIASAWSDRATAHLWLTAAGGTGVFSTEPYICRISK